MSEQNSCEYCLNYVYGDEYDYYVCSVDLDMDEQERFINGTLRNCPYFMINNEYKIVEKQN